MKRIFIFPTIEEAKAFILTEPRDPVFVGGVGMAEIAAATLRAVKAKKPQLVVLAGIWDYALLLAAHMELSFPLLLKHAAVLWAAGRQASVAGSVLALAILCAGALWFPASLPLLFLLGFSLACFSFCFFGWKTAERHIFLPYYRRHPEEAAAQGYRFDREENPV